MEPKFTFAHEDGGFDNHINKSIRGYNDMSHDVIEMSQYFVQPRSIVLDLGCSTGRMLRAIYEKNKDYLSECSFIGIDYEESFRDAFKETWKDVGDDRMTTGVDPMIVARNKNIVDFYGTDLTTYNMSNLMRTNPYSTETNYVSYAMSVFTLQFMPRVARERVLKNVYQSLLPGGAFVCAEKIYADTAKVQDMMTFLYYDYKKKSFSEKEIMDKEVKLRHMLRPTSRDDLEKMLHSAGFETIYPFWQNYNFVAYVCIKKDRLGV